MIGSLFGVAISIRACGVPESYLEQHNLTSTKSLYFTKCYFFLWWVLNVCAGLTAFVLAIFITVASANNSELYFSSNDSVWQIDGSTPYTCNSQHYSLTNSFTASNGGTVDEFCAIYNEPGVTYCCSLTK
jgi:hypothetical protein